MKKYFLYTAAVAFLMAACTKEPLMEDLPQEEEMPVSVTGVSLNLPDALLLVGGTLTLEATVEPGDATNVAVTWSSDDGSVATVNPEGEVTAVAPGTAIITVTTDDGEFTTICAVTVENENLPVPVTGVTLNLPDALLLVGSTLTLEATVEPSDATNEAVTWGSDDDSVATVNSEGEVTVVALGTTTITATTDDGGFTAICTVTVQEEPPEEPVPCIAMTTMASEVNFMLYITTEGTDNIAIDWGDGEESTIGNASLPFPNFDWYNFSHIYSGVSEHRITITGYNIEVLYCPYNKLKTLDVSHYPELQSLECFNNQLTTLDMRKNTKLKRLHCEYNHLTTSALNNLFLSLHDITVSYTKQGPNILPFSLYIHDNHGTSNCDVSIAVTKGWHVFR